MADRDTLIQSYKDSHPGATDEEAIQGLLSLMPGADSQITNLNLPPANNMSSSYDINTSAATVPMKGNTALMEAPITSPSKQPIELSKEIPLPPVETPSPVVPISPPISSVMKQPKEKVSVNEVAQALGNENFSADNAKREEMLAANEKSKKLGVIPIALAGAGDAISNASAAFGGHPGDEQMGKIVTMQKEQEESRKKEFEDKLKNDPQSNISKSYRQMVLKIAPDLSGNSNFEKMSAMAIGEKLPLIDTMMKASASKDAREMSLAAMKENRSNLAEQKNLALGEKEDQFNQRRWERFGTAVNPMNAGSRRALGVAAVNNMRADRLLSTAGNKELTSQDYSNLIADLQGIYKGGVPDQEMARHGDYPSIQRKAGQILGMLSGNPSAIHTPEILNHLTMLTRELKEVDNKVINDNMGFNAVIFDELKKSDPDKFARAMQALSEMTVGASDTGSSTKGGPLAPSIPSMSSTSNNKPANDPLGLF